MRRERDVMMEKRSERFKIADFEDGGRGSEPRNAGSL